MIYSRSREQTVAQCVAQWCERLEVERVGMTMKKRNVWKGLSILLTAAMLVGGVSQFGLVAHAEEDTVTWEETTLLVNGNFEDGSNGWNATVSVAEGVEGTEGDTYGYLLKTDSWASNNTSQFLNVWNNAAEGMEFSLSQTVSNVETGKYKLSFQQEGAAMTSGLNLYVGGTELALAATTGWDVWETYESEEFTLTEAEDITLTISGSVVSGYWGDFDNFVLLRTDLPDDTANDDNTNVSDGNENVTVTLQDAEFTGELWNDGIWTVSTAIWENTSFENYTYADNEWLTVGENQGTTSFKFWMQDAGNFTLLQTIATLPAGSYKLSADFMGEAADVKLVLGEQSGAVNILGGWNVWTDAEETFTVGEDAENVTVGFSVDVQAGGYGYIDSIAIEKVESENDNNNDGTNEGTNTEGDNSQSSDENGNFDALTGTWKATDLVVNGNFEADTIEGDATVASGWTVTLANGEEGTYGNTVKTDTWAVNNSTRMLNVWNNSTASTVDVTISQTIENVVAGNYKLGFDLEGGATVTGLTVNVGDTNKELPATTGWDGWQTVETDVFTLTEESDVTITISGALTTAFDESNGYWIDLDNFVLYKLTTEEEVQPVEAEIHVEKVENLPDDFIGGLDISSYVTLKNSGVKFYDFDGNELNDQEFFDLLAECGVNYIRVRVWNDPYDADGNGYGGGNNDVEIAKQIGQWTTNAGMKLLVDFHYSDFWADPGKQQVPKDWVGMAIEQKCAAVKEFTENSLKTLLDAGVDVGMVQVGNETTNAIAGESGWSDNMMAIFDAGCDAVHEVESAYEKDILVAVHFTNPERENYGTFAKNLDNYNIDYDVFASSYYPYWHGTLDNLKAQLSDVYNTYGKRVMVAETSWAYTLEDGDGHSNTVRAGNNDSGQSYDFNINGQALELRSVIDTIAKTDGGLGVFYWEAAWLPVQVYDADAENAEEILAANKATWEKEGSGWASSYAGEYDAKDAGVWYGGSAVDNQALFDFTGHPLATLNIFNYVKTGTVAPVTVSAIEEPSVTTELGVAVELPATVQVSYSDGTKVDVNVTWNAEQLATALATGVGTYTINGTLTIDEESGETNCTLVIKPVNLLPNFGFEDSDTSMWTITGDCIGIKADSSNVMSGSYCLHFWSGSAASYSVEQKLVLDAGVYSFGTFLEGGDAGENDVFKAYVVNGHETLEALSGVSGWQTWREAVVENIIVKEDNTEITVGVMAEISANAWGAWDDLYLYRIGDVSADEGNGGGAGSDNSGNDSGSSDNEGSDNYSSDNSGNDDDIIENRDNSTRATINQETTINEEQTPLTSTVEEVKEEVSKEETKEENVTEEKQETIVKETVVIEEEEAPLASGVNPVIYILIATLIVCGGVGIALRLRGKTEEE